MEKLLSVIIPTYNMGRYLRRCLDSLIISHLKFLEVWVVNDGSRDNSSAIAHEYVDKYPGIFNVIDKENGNYGSCVNAALPRCTGKYIKVLDSDDWFDIDNLDSFVCELQDIEADMIISDYVRVVENSSEREYETFNLTKKQLINMDEILDERLKFVQMHAVAYRTDLFKKFDYHQTEGISYTDQQWIFMPLMRAETCYYYPSIIYCYLIGREGQTMDTAVVVKSADHLIRGILPMMEDYHREVHAMPSKRKSYFEDRLVMRIKYIYELYLLSDEVIPTSSLIKFDEQLKEMLPDIYERLNTESVNKFIKYKYILAWRSKGRMNRNIIPILRLYEKVRKFCKK